LRSDCPPGRSGPRPVRRCRGTGDRSCSGRSRLLATPHAGSGSTRCGAGRSAAAPPRAGRPGKWRPCARRPDRSRLGRSRQEWLVGSRQWSWAKASVGKHHIHQTEYTRVYTLVFSMCIVWP
jgi:hypothetical protein